MLNLRTRTVTRRIVLLIAVLGVILDAIRALRTPGSTLSDLQFVAVVALALLVWWLTREDERALRTASEAYHQLVNDLPLVIYVTLPGGHLPYVSPRIEALLGYPLADWLNGTVRWRDIVHSDDFTTIRDRNDYCRRNGIEFNAEYRIRAADGHYLWVKDRAVPRRNDGSHAMHGVLVDISALKAVEAELADERSLLLERVTERTEELQRANTELARAARIKNEFLSSMSHELRTPLHAILTLSESLDEGVYGGLSERQLRTVQTIVESGRHLLTLINDLLDLSKIEAGRADLQIDTIDVHEVLDSALRMNERHAELKGVRLIRSYDTTIPPIEADARRLRQIVVNLLSNAVKFTPPGGRIELRTGLQTEHGRVTVSVSDTGIGISADQQHLLFQPFSQADSSLSRLHGGSGLGLALVRRLAELHGGTASVESSPGRGSTFTIELPYRNPAAAIGEMTG